MPTLDKIRSIQIYKADYNFILHTIWGRRLVWNAQKHNAYMPAQQAQPGNLCLGEVLNKVLSYYLNLQIKEVVASFDNDCKGAYDNLVPPQAMLNYLRMGLPRTEAKILETILNNTICKLKTGHNLSARAYMSNSLRRILGTGQGSCASPSI